MGEIFIETVVWLKQRIAADRHLLVIRIYHIHCTYIQYEQHTPVTRQKRLKRQGLSLSVCTYVRDDVCNIRTVRTYVYVTRECTLCSPLPRRSSVRLYI